MLGNTLTNKNNAEFYPTEKKKTASGADFHETKNGNGICVTISLHDTYSIWSVLLKPR